MPKPAAKRRNIDISLKHSKEPFSKQSFPELQDLIEERHGHSHTHTHTLVTTTKRLKGLVMKRTAQGTNKKTNEHQKYPDAENRVTDYMTVALKSLDLECGP